MMSIFGRWRHVWRSTIDTFVLETVHSIYYSGPLQNGGNHRRRYVSCILSFFFNNKKDKISLFQVYCAISTTLAPRIPATRARSATQARSMDRSLAPAPPVTRGSTARRTSTSASRVSNHFHSLLNSWKILRLQLRKWSRNESLFFLSLPLRSITRPA